MIIFSVAYGEAYISQLCNRCLPSLLSKHGMDVAGEPIRLAIFTLKKDFNFLVVNLSASETLQKFVAANRVDIASIEEPQTPGGMTSAAMLVQGIYHCIDRNESWVHAVPDLVYSSTALETCWALHKVTGKVVAMFNGRLKALQSDDTPFTDEAYLRSADDMPRFFFKNMIDAWHAYRVTTLDALNGAQPGRLVVDAPSARLVFETAVNPFVGRFEPEDMFAFQPPDNFGAWDHAWKDTLERQNRLVVLTNLDLGMSIEPVADGGIGKTVFEGIRTAFVKRAMPPLNADVARKVKFGAPGMHCFTAEPESED